MELTQREKQILRIMISEYLSLSEEDQKNLNFNSYYTEVRELQKRLIKNF